MEPGSCAVVLRRRELARVLFGERRRSRRVRQRDARLSGAKAIEPGSCAVVLRRRELARVLSASDDEVGGSDSAIRA